MVRAQHETSKSDSIGPQDQEAQSLDDNFTVTREMRTLYCVICWDFCLPPSLSAMPATSLGKSTLSESTPPTCYNT